MRSVAVALLAAMAVGGVVQVGTADAGREAQARPSGPLLRIPRLPRPRVTLPKPPRVNPRVPPQLIRPWRAVVDDLARALTYDDANAALTKLYRRDNYKKLMVDAFCTAMEYVRRQGPPDLTFSTDEWRRYFVGYLDYYWRSHLQRYSRHHARQVVDGWLETWEMTLVSPAVGAFYYRACVWGG